jgi:hypothetical protein
MTQGTTDKQRPIRSGFTAASRPTTSGRYRPVQRPGQGRGAAVAGSSVSRPVGLTCSTSRRSTRSSPGISRLAVRCTSCSTTPGSWAARWCATSGAQARSRVSGGRRPTAARSQRDHDLAVDVASGLQRDGIADVLDGKDRGYGHGDLTREERIGDLLHCIRPCLDAAGGAHAAGRVGAGGDGGDPFGWYAERQRLSGLSPCRTDPSPRSLRWRPASVPGPPDRGRMPRARRRAAAGTRRWPLRLSPSRWRRRVWRAVRRRRRRRQRRRRSGRCRRAAGRSPPARRRRSGRPPEACSPPRR